MERSKSILVTGTAGFVGTSMAQRLLEQGHTVHGIDNLITGSWNNIQLLKNYPKFNFSHMDINDAGALMRLSDNNYSEIYHFACPTGVPNIKKYGEEMMRTCSTGTENVLCVAKQHNASLVYTSSAEVYGDPEQFPQVESYNGNVDPVGERSSYEEGKRFGEMLVRLYADKYGVKGKIVRIFNSYGPHMSRTDTRLIPNFLRKISAGEPLVVYGNGEQTRTHLFITDLLNGLQCVMANGDVATPYNVGGNTQMTINELIQTLGKVLGKNFPVQYKEHYIEDHAGREPDVKRAQNLGWSSTVSLTEGLSQMCAEYGITKATPDVKQTVTPATDRAGMLDGLPV